VATLFDTSAVAAYVRRRSPHEQVVQVARAELAAGGAVLSVVSAAELLIGARDEAGGARLKTLIEALTVVPVDLTVGMMAGELGAYARRRGATIPLPDLLIAATALRLELPVLTVDSDFARGRSLALDDSDPGGEEGGRLWRRLQLHAASTGEE
jgi:predicted nucleic acid-binding protein